MVSPLDDYAGDDRSDLRGTQRQEVQRRVRNGEYGWTQARRVFPDQDILRAFDEGVGGAGSWSARLVSRLDDL